MKVYVIEVNQHNDGKYEDFCHETEIGKVFHSKTDAIKYVKSITMFQDICNPYAEREEINFELKEEREDESVYIYTSECAHYSDDTKSMILRIIEREVE